MKRLLCARIPEKGRPVELDPAEAGHATRVLRLGNGDIVEAMDGKGHAAQAQLKVRGDHAWLEYVPSEKGPAPEGSRSPRPLVILEMAVLKGEAMEWVVEKAVELNVHTLVPTLTAHTVVQTKHKGPEAFRERWQKIADQALKQCGRLQRMEVLAPLPLEELLAKYPATPDSPRIWCDEAERGTATPIVQWALSTKRKDGTSFSVRVLIGPEGGWSANERQFLSNSPIHKVSLGDLVLRAETAAIYSISAISGAFAITHPDQASS